MGRRILLVEDDLATREFVAEYLESGGYDVVTAATPGEALVAGAVAFDVLVTDVLLPGMRGTALAARLRAEHPRLCTVIVSGEPPAAEPPESGTAFLGKPFRLATLTLVIERLLAERG